MSYNDKLVLRLVTEVTQNAAQPIDRMARAVDVRKDSGKKDPMPAGAQPM
jgi:hypothetical protein